MLLFHLFPCRMPNISTVLPLSNPILPPFPIRNRFVIPHLRIPQNPTVLSHRPAIDTILSFYFTFSCNLVQCTVDLDDHTTMHFWAPAHRKFHKSNLIMIHGYGGNSKWQFVHQVGQLSKSFNLYIPDLLFFGNSVTSLADRSEYFQAECVGAGLKRLGVGRCSVYGISYGGYVAYRTAKIYPEMVEKLVIVSSGVGCTEELKGEHLKRTGVDVVDLLLPEKPAGLRRLVKMTVHNSTICGWAPDFVLQKFIDVMCNANRKGKRELVEHLLANKPECSNHGTLSQETLLIWGDKDKIFPLCFAHELQRNLGRRSRLEVLLNTGHAANIDSPDLLNALIRGFVMD